MTSITIFVDQQHTTHRHTGHLDGVLLEDAQLQEDVELDFPLVKEFLHVSLSLLQLLQNALDVSDRARVRQLITAHR